MSLGSRAGELARAKLRICRRSWLVPRRFVAGRRVGDESRAYTTVMTVLGRLVDKALVERVEEGKTHRYRAAGDPDELTAQAIRALLSATAHPRVALARFIEHLDDPQLVAELATAVKRRRRRP